MAKASRGILTPFEARLVLSLCPRGTHIVRARYFRHHAYPCPVRVTVALPSGADYDFVVRKVRHRRGSVEREAALYPVLARLGMPTPQVLAGPAVNPRQPGEPPAVILSILPGMNLQELSTRGGRNLVRAQDLLIGAVSWMHRVTSQVAASPAGRLVPHGGLAEHLDLVLHKQGPWQQEVVFRDAALRLRRVVEHIRTPLVFSNGDYNPANFLVENGRISGFVDFEHAWFEDPLYGFAKYPIYDLRPLNHSGVIAAFLKRHGFTDRDFAPRLALGCLAALSRELPVRGGNRKYRAHVLRLLNEQLARL